MTADPDPLFWISFLASDCFLGAVLVRAHCGHCAAMKTMELGCVPNEPQGEYAVQAVDPLMPVPPVEFMERLMDETEIKRFEKALAAKGH